MRQWFPPHLLLITNWIASTTSDAAFDVRSLQTIGIVFCTNIQNLYVSYKWEKTKTLILISAILNSFSAGTCCFMTWYNSNMSILLGMTNSCSKDNAKFAYNIPKNPYEQLGWQLRIMLSKLQILSCPHLHKRGQLWIFNIDFDFEDVQSNWFTSVRLHNPVISEFQCYRPSLTPKAYNTK